MGHAWKKGRGKLGFMQPLLGKWSAVADTPMGPMSCVRQFTSILKDNYIRLDALWKLQAKGNTPTLSTAHAGGYEEFAIIGVGEEKKVGFWSFTSDGKRSQGTVTDVTDLHKDAIGFEAHMPAGLARMAYWPDGED